MCHVRSEQYRISVVDSTSQYDCRLDSFVPPFQANRLRLKFENDRREQVGVS